MLGKSMSGPDFLDVATSMYELQEEWDLSLSILIELDGSVGGCGFYVHVLGVPKDASALAAEEGVSASIRWPDRDGRTFPGSLIQLLLTCDSLLDKASSGATRR